MWWFLAGVVAGGAVCLVVVRRWPDRRVGIEDRPSTDGAIVAVDPVPVDEPDTNDRWSDVFDALPLGVVVIAADGGELLRNATARSVAGARHADVLIDEVVERMIASALAGTSGAEQMQLAGPPQRVLAFRARPLEGGGALATIEDITERSRVDQVRTDFVANVSHELKTPVGAMSVLAETLAGESTDELVSRLAQRMVVESSRLGRTIDDLLQLSHIEMGADTVSETLDMNDVVAEAVDTVQPIATRDGVTVSFERLAPAPVRGDAVQLTSAVRNLVDNAVKYGRTGGAVEVTVAVSGGFVEVAVTDHGIGIPTESLDRVFERFYRVDRARTRTTGGTGLGLSIVRHVVTNHGGEVNVSSREGEGSTFTLRLPCATGTSRGTM